MRKPDLFARSFITMAIIGTLAACGGSESESVTVDTGSSEEETDTGSTADSCDNPVTSLPAIFLEFNASANVTAVLSSDGCTVTVEANGKPNHTSSYWDSGNESGLYVEPEDPDLFDQRRSPGDIEDYINLFQLTVPVNPELADSSSATPLGAIGIATSGAPIFNDSEGNGDVSLGVIQGFDRNGAHTGPQTYHYHLEPRAITYDDDSLVGIMSDGFFIYGRRCYSSADYPSDLDASNGHIGVTQFTDASNVEGEYHYHVSAEQYLNGEYYLIFPGDFQGTPNGVN
ncbi:YHYH protein [Alteromonas portus]|uniref:YHYH protein n=1 Tax=Alteromonas portus TaxID=2565549 RepID=A0A4U0ZCG7_9ALTE|nr:YHYH protein [Alteromonas portus]TKB02267.1 YHYH protein [Alteromonas portus]